MKSLEINIRMRRKENLFIAGLALIQGDLDKLVKNIESLHPMELTQFHKYKYDRRKESYLLGRLSVKQAVKQAEMHLNQAIHPKKIWLDSGVFRFPILRCLKAANLNVSLSHCDNIGISIAFPDVHPMGIDLERVEESRKDILLDYTSVEEKKILTNINIDNIIGYTMIWSIKEALSKTIKTGLMIDFNLLEINDIKKENNIFKSTFHSFNQYKTFSIVNEHYVISIVSPKKTEIQDINKLEMLLNAILIDEMKFVKHAK